MEPFVVSARKYRPQTFKDVVGQEAITNTLQNAIENNHLAQALLFTGPRGVGKTTCARILAKMINTDDETANNEDFSFNIFELDAASNNSVDDIRSLTDQVRIPPQVGKYKVYIIDEVHMLSQAAFNAFLKTLEEPPKHCIFILATTEKHKIIPTILSRCQIFDFKRISVIDAKNYLKYIAKNQGVTADDDALHIIAKKADGAMRDALSIFDRVVSFTGNELTRKAVTENLNVLDYDTFFTSTDLILEGKIPELLIQFNGILGQGFDGHHFIAGLDSHFRDLLVCKDIKTIELLEVGEETKETYKAQSQKASSNFLLSAIELSNDCDLKYKTSKNKRLLVELTLMQLASIMFNGEKKKLEFKLIPPNHFSSNTQASPNSPKVNSVKQTTETLPEADDSKLIETNPIKEQTISKPKSEETIQPSKITISQSKKVTSGLSLKSIVKKKEHLIKQLDVEINEEDLPKQPVKQEDLDKAWKDYIAQLHKKGEKILASILEMEQPQIKNHSICLSYSNNTSKLEVERAQYPLLAFLKKRLKNYELYLDISVNEELAKKYAFSAREKFEKMKEKNPNIDVLRKTFGLDVD